MATPGSQRQLDPDDGKPFDEAHYEEFFARLTEKKSYPYQTKLARKLTSGRIADPAGSHRFRQDLGDCGAFYLFLCNPK